VNQTHKKGLAAEFQQLMAVIVFGSTVEVKVRMLGLTVVGVRVRVNLQAAVANRSQRSIDPERYQHDRHRQFEPRSQTSRQSLSEDYDQQSDCQQ
jgi:uncharacterized metal-binding protein YceD (DUF177 family)